MKKILSAFIAAVYLSVNCVLAHSTESNFWASRRAASQKVKGETANLQEGASAQRGNLLLAQLPMASPVNLAQGKVDSGPVRGGDSARSPFSIGPKAGDWLGKMVSPYGSVRDVYLSPKKDAPFIVHIQDAHGIEEAQRNISSMIEIMGQEPKIQLVGLEAAWGPFSLQPYRDYPDANITKEIADFFLKKGLIAGPEYAGLTLSSSPDFFGAEDKTLYDANVLALKTAYKSKQAAQTQLDVVLNNVAALKSLHYSEELKIFDGHFEGYHSEKEKLAVYVRYLVETNQAVRAVASVPNLDLLGRALDEEDRLNFKLVEKERRDLVEQLANKLNVQQMQDLVAKSVDYRAGRVGYGEYHSHLIDVCRQHGIGVGQWAHLNRYISYVTVADKIDKNSLLEEMDFLDRAIPERLARTAAEKKLVSIAYDLTLMAKLLRHEMAPTDWAAYEKRVGEIHRLGDRLKEVEPTGNWESLSAETLKPFEEFCSFATQRNSALTDNLLRRMGETQAKSAVLVAGGFHTEGLSALLRDKQVSYVVVTPKITEIPRDNKYLDLLASDPVPLEKQLAGDRIYLAKMVGMREEMTQQLLTAVQHVAQLMKAVVDMGNSYAITTDVAYAGAKVLFKLNDGRNIYLVSNYRQEKPFSEFSSRLINGLTLIIKNLSTRLLSFVNSIPLPATIKEDAIMLLGALGLFGGPFVSFAILLLLHIPNVIRIISDKDSSTSKRILRLATLFAALTILQLLWIDWAGSLDTISNLKALEIAGGISLLHFLYSYFTRKFLNSIFQPATSDFLRDPQRNAEGKLGDLSDSEIKLIQSVVDKMGTRLFVVGSAAKGTRRGVGTELPFSRFGGEKKGTRSDIDYAIVERMDEDPNLKSLPDVDPNFGVLGKDYLSLANGPAIEFNPNKNPIFHPQENRRIPLTELEEVTEKPAATTDNEKSGGLVILWYNQLIVAIGLFMEGNKWNTAWSQAGTKIRSRTFSLFGAPITELPALPWVAQAFGGGVTAILGSSFIFALLHHLRPPPSFSAVFKDASGVGGKLMVIVRAIWPTIKLSIEQFIFIDAWKIKRDSDSGKLVFGVGIQFIVQTLAAVIINFSALYIGGDSYLFTGLVAAGLHSTYNFIFPRFGLPALTAGGEEKDGRLNDEIGAIIGLIKEGRRLLSKSNPRKADVTTVFENISAAMTRLKTLSKNLNNPRMGYQQWEKDNISKIINEQIIQKRLFPSLPSLMGFVDKLSASHEEGAIAAAHKAIDLIGPHFDMYSDYERQNAPTPIEMHEELDRTALGRIASKGNVTADSVLSVAQDIRLSNSQIELLETLGAIERSGLKPSFPLMEVVGKNTGDSYRTLWEDTKKIIGSVYRPQFEADETEVSKQLSDLTDVLQMIIEDNKEGNAADFRRKYPNVDAFISDLSNFSDAPAPLAKLWFGMSETEYARFVDNLFLTEISKGQVVIDGWKIFYHKDAFNGKLFPLNAIKALVKKFASSVEKSAQQRGGEYSKKGILRDDFAQLFWGFVKKDLVASEITILWFGTGQEAHANVSTDANSKVAETVFQRADSLNGENRLPLMGSEAPKKGSPVRGTVGEKPAATIKALMPLYHWMGRAFNPEWSRIPDHEKLEQIIEVYAPVVESVLFGFVFGGTLALLGFLGIDLSTLQKVGIWGAFNGIFALSHRTFYVIENGEWKEKKLAEVGKSSHLTLWLASLGVHSPFLGMMITPAAFTVPFFLSGFVSSVLGSGFHHFYNKWVAQPFGLPALTVGGKRENLKEPPDEWTPPRELTFLTPNQLAVALIDSWENKELNVFHDLVELRHLNRNSIPSIINMYGDEREKQIAGIRGELGAFINVSISPITAPTEEIPEISKIIASSGEFIKALTKNELALAVKNMFGFNLAPAEIQDTLSLEFIPSTGDHKHVFKAKINLVRGPVRSLEIPFAILKEEKEDATDQLHPHIGDKEFEDLIHLRDSGLVPHVGLIGEMDNGRRIIIEPFINGETVDQLIRHGQLNNKLRKEITLTLFKISDLINDQIPFDAHGGNFIYDANKKQMVMVDLGDLRADIGQQSSSDEAKAYTMAAMMKNILMDYGDINGIKFQENNALFSGILLANRAKGLYFLNQIAQLSSDPTSQMDLNLIKTIEITRDFVRHFSITREGIQKKHIATSFNNFFVEGLSLVLPRRLAIEWGMRLLPLEMGGIVAAGWMAPVWVAGLVPAMVGLDPIALGVVGMVVGLALFKASHYALQYARFYWLKRGEKPSVSVSSFLREVRVFAPYVALPLLVQSTVLFAGVAAYAAWRHYSYDAKVLNQENEMNAAALKAVIALMEGKNLGRVPETLKGMEVGGYRSAGELLKTASADDIESAIRVLEEESATVDAAVEYGRQLALAEGTETQKVAVLHGIANWEEKTRTIALAVVRGMLLAGKPVLIVAEEGFDTATIMYSGQTTHEVLIVSDLNGELMPTVEFQRTSKVPLSNTVLIREEDSSVLDGTKYTAFTFEGISRAIQNALETLMAAIRAA